MSSLRRAASSTHLWTPPSHTFYQSGIDLTPVLERLRQSSRHTSGQLRNHQSRECSSSGNPECLNWISSQVWRCENIEHVRILSEFKPPGTMNVSSRPLIEPSCDDWTQEITPFSYTVWFMKNTPPDKIFRDRVSTLWNIKWETGNQEVLLRRVSYVPLSDLLLFHVVFYALPFMPLKH